MKSPGRRTLYENTHLWCSGFLPPVVFTVHLSPISNKKALAFGMRYPSTSGRCWAQNVSTTSIAVQPPSSSSHLDLFEEVDLTDFKIPPLVLPAESTQECCICFESYGPSDMARLPECDHVFCRECLIGHVRSKLSDMVFPIYCPLCILDSGLEDPTGVFHFQSTRAWNTHVFTLIIEIDQRTLNRLTDVLERHEYDKFETLQLSIYAMSLQCPK